MNTNSANTEPQIKKLKIHNLVDDKICGDIMPFLKANGIENRSADSKNNKAINNTLESDNDKIESIDNEDVANLATENDSEDESFSFPSDTDITEMLSEVEYKGTFPTITQRYFTAYYKLNVQKPNDDMCILLHSNRVCMLTLAPSHAALCSDHEITEINFKVSEKLDRAMNKVSGKSKHGAQPLQTNSNICVIACSNGQTYTIKCCMIGKLVEVNENLLHNPKLLLQPPHRGGYLAIILPNIKLLDKMKENLLTQEQYDISILARGKTVEDLQTGDLREHENTQNIKRNHTNNDNCATDINKTDCNFTSINDQQTESIS